MKDADMRQSVLRVKGHGASKVVALRKLRARRESQTSAATRLRERRRERRPRRPETIRRQASAGEAHLPQEPFPTRMICKRGGPSARPFACVSPLLAASREARATPSARARRRMPRPASRAIDGASTSPPAARQSYPYVRPAADLFPSDSWIGRLRSAVDSRRLSARQPTMRR